MSFVVVDVHCFCFIHRLCIIMPAYKNSPGARAHMRVSVRARICACARVCVY